MFNFEYDQEIYDEVKNAKRYYLAWRNQEKTWRYRNCAVKIIGMDNNRARIIVRRKKSGYSKFMNSDFEVNLMMGFVAVNVERKEDESHRNILFFEIEQSNDKFHRDLKNVKIWSEYEHETEDLYNAILQQKNNPQDTNIIEAYYLERNNSMVPVIYQPRVDAWENFLREIHVHREESDGVYHITLVFQDEVLRKHGILDEIYRYIRLIKYNRTVDIESFTYKDNKFFFEDIYSGDGNLFEDTVHNQREIDSKYYFQDNNHPVIFVNTSNHALAPHDNNHDLWKWEYVPWSNKIPIKLGNKTRDEADKEYQAK